MTDSVIQRRRTLVAASCVSVVGAIGASANFWPVSARPARREPSPKTLRLAVGLEVSSLDPAVAIDSPSALVTAHVFETLYEYDPTANPYALRPCTASAMPEISADQRVLTIRMQRGIYFTDDAAFGGHPRELTAEDYVYSLKRIYDPKSRSPLVDDLEAVGLIGLNELRQQAMQPGALFDYTREVAGVQALDRYTLRFRLKEPRLLLQFLLAAKDTMGALAHEVVARYGDRIGEHPVGTGPYRVVRWDRGAGIVLERNAGHRRPPKVERVEVTVVPEPSSRWMSFVQQEHDVLLGVPPDYVAIAFDGQPATKVAPWAAKRGITASVNLAPDVTMAMWNMRDPVVGGLSPARVALRRAIALATDRQLEIRHVHGGQAIAAQTIIPPRTTGYDPKLRTEASIHDLARAKALLDIYEYKDRDGDGWRETPEGAPLKIVLSSTPGSTARRSEELWVRTLKAIGIRSTVSTAQWSSTMQAVQAGNFQVWQTVLNASNPDGHNMLAVAYGPGAFNFMGFKLPMFDRLYEQAAGMPDGPKRDAVLQQAALLLVAYAPLHVGVHHRQMNLAHRRVRGFNPDPYAYDWWQYVDLVDDE